MTKQSTQNELGMEIASKLLDIEAIRLDAKNPFTWSSGWKSPIYCDNRLSLSYPSIRDLVKNALASVIQEKYKGVEAIAGVATAGIPQGALVADMLGLPFLYVRSKPKGHGMENLIEGKITTGQQVVIIEDLVSTGGSSLKAAEALKAAGFEIMGMAAVFTYDFDLARENFHTAGIPLVCLGNYHDLLEEALRRKYITRDELGQLKKWREDPANWRLV